MELNLKGFQGYVKKTAAVLSDDPANPRVILLVEGTVKPLIEVRPDKTVYFQGIADGLSEKAIDLITTSKQFHIRKVEDNLDKKAAYRLETVEDGKHYRLRVTNNTLRGNYRGSITLYTDFAEKPELTVWVNGSIEGEIGIRPKVLVVGRLSPDQGVISGKVLVVDNKNRPFKIVRCTYD
ncbi:MAG: OS_HP3 family (seleno)protein, partial [Syntrophobacteraceae bacterium]